MADPAIQTFCCIANNRTRLGLDNLLHYRYESYNAICIVSSFLGIIGAIYQILPRQFEGTGRVLTSYMRGRQIIVWLAAADLLASFAVFIRSTSWLMAQQFQTNTSYYVGSVFCAISSGWIQYFYACTYLWTLFYAIDILRVVKNLPGKPVVYHIFVWTIPLLCNVIGLMILYYPDFSCHSMESNPFKRILPNYLLIYLPMLFIMIANPLIYFHASNQAEKVISSTGRFTSIERKQLRILRLKFLSINAVFVICWLPNLLNALAVWTLWWDLPKEPVLASAYLMALLNPLQALLNALVYRKWGDTTSTVKIKFPWTRPRLSSSEETHLLTPRNGSVDGNGNEEDLSGSIGQKSTPINGYGSF